MKLAYSTLGCPDWKFNEIIAMAKDFGFDGVEVRGIRSKIYAPEIKAFQDEFWPENKEKMERLDIEIPMLTSGICIKEKYETMVAETKAYADLADKIGAKYIRILADADVEPSKNVSDEAVIENINELLKATNGNKAIFLLETNGAFADTSRLKKIIEAVNSPRVQVLWDVHHPYRIFGETAEQTFENVGKYVKYVHIKDSIYENGKVAYKMMGKGDMPLDSFIKVLKTENYNGYISLEWVKRWMPGLEEPGIVFMQYINYMKRKI